MHRIYALKYTEASKTFNQFFEHEKDPRVRLEERNSRIYNRNNIQQTQGKGNATYNSIGIKTWIGAA